MWNTKLKASYSSTFHEDNSDRKSLDMLRARIDLLLKKSPDLSLESTKRSSRISKLKSVPATTRSVKESGISKSKSGTSSSKISNTKVKATLKDNGATITSNSNAKWIKKGNPSRSKSKSSKQEKSKDKWKQATLAETFGKSIEKHSNKSSKEKKVKTVETLTNSFEKYSIKTPSHEEIMAYRKQSEREKEMLEKLQKEMEDSLESDINFNIDDTVVSDDVKVLDCKHLTDDKVNEYFQKHYKHMYDIHHDNISTARSDKYKKGGDTRELRYNTSSCTFTYEQKKLMYSLLHDKFGNENFMCTNDQYFFQVLIPELCLKIFMDVYDMTLEEATNYLDNAPVKIKI